MKIGVILDQIDLGSIALPEFQRGYVWNRDQVRGLMQSLYLGHPVGSLLVWVTPTQAANTRGGQDLPPGFVKLLLDGQQRVTSLYGLVRGKAPAFFEGNERAFTDLRFHLGDKVFSFYQPLKMRDDPLWVDVTELLQKGAGVVVQRFVADPAYADRVGDFLDRLNRIDRIKETDLHIEEVTGKDKTIDVVVGIFNRVNSGGTKLSKGDLALAKVCAQWPEARQRLNRELGRWSDAGYYFRLELLLRSVTTTLTGEAMFSALDGVESAAFQNGLKTTVQHIDRLLNLIGSRLGLDHDRVLGGRYALPLMSRYLTQRGGAVSDPRERDKLLYWYVNKFSLGTLRGVDGVRSEPGSWRHRGHRGWSRPANREPAPGPGRSAPSSGGLPWVEPGRAVLPAPLHAHAGVGGARLGDRRRTQGTPARQPEQPGTAPHIPEGATVRGGIRALPGQRTRQFHLPDQGDESQGVGQ